eukprot:2000339-Pleurochrysis_carterae.AAC.1
MPRSLCDAGNTQRSLLSPPSTAQTGGARVESDDGKGRETSSLPASRSYRPRRQIRQSSPEIDAGRTHRKAGPVQ